MTPIPTDDHWRIVREQIDPEAARQRITGRRS